MSILCVYMQAMKAVVNLCKCSNLAEPSLLDNAIRPNKKRSVLGNRSEIGTHNYFNFFFLEKKNIILCILKGTLPFKMHKIIFF